MRRTVAAGGGDGREGGGGSGGGMAGAAGAHGGHVAVVGHGRSMKFFMGAVLGMDPAEAVDLPQPNTCINVLDWDFATGSFSKVALGIAEHWDGAGAT